MPKRIFFNAPLSSLAEQRLNSEIAQMVRDLGFEIYLPQIEIPPTGNTSATRVFESNIQAVRHSDIILSVLDKPGLGVAFELGYAIAINKIIIAFRSDEQDYLGKVLEGLWKSLEARYKAQTLEELKEILGRNVEISL